MDRDVGNGRTDPERREAARAARYERGRLLGAITSVLALMLFLGALAAAVSSSVGEVPPHWVMAAATAFAGAYAAIYIVAIKWSEIVPPPEAVFIRYAAVAIGWGALMIALHRPGEPYRPTWLTLIEVLALGAACLSWGHAVMQLRGWWEGGAPLN